MLQRSTIDFGLIAGPVRQYFYSSCALPRRPLDQITALPRAWLYQVSQTLSIRAPTIASLRSAYARRQTPYKHQLWLKGYLGLNDFDQTASNRLVAYLNAQAVEAISVDELVMAANRWLYEQRFVIPKSACTRPRLGSELQTSDIRLARSHNAPAIENDANLKRGDFFVGAADASFAA